MQVKASKLVLMPLRWAPKSLKPHKCIGKGKIVTNYGNTLVSKSVVE